MVAIAGDVRAPVIHLDDAAQHYDVLGHSEVLDDPSGDLDIDDVTHSSAFRPGSADGQPPDDGVRWYRFRAEMPPRSDAHWYIGTNRLCNDADLFLPRGNGGYSLHPFGYGVPFVKHPAPGPNPMLSLPAQTGQTLYVRLQCYRYSQSLYLMTDRSSPSYVLQETAITVTIPLVILAFGLAAVTRSRAFLFLAFTGMLYALPLRLADPTLFPTRALLPIVIQGHIVHVIYFTSAFLFYAEFFQLWTRNRRAWFVLLGTTVFTIVISIGVWYLPLHLLNMSHLLNAVGFSSLYIVAACIGIIVARAGNRSAWFLVAGSIIWLITFALELFPGRVPVLLGELVFFASPADIILFTIGVGDQLRQALLAHQAVLEEKGIVQSQLVSEQERYIADIERRNESFSRFVPAEFLLQLNRRDIVDVQLGDHVQCDIAIFFADIRGFTTLSEQLSPAETFEFVNDYLARAGPVIRSHGGFIDKYVGDAIMALFPERPSGALDAAIALQREVRRFNEDRAQKDAEPIAIGIGLHYGRVTLGTIGEPRRVETTVIADAVNATSRIEGMTKVVGAPIIASAALVEALDDGHAYCLRPIGEIHLRGKAHATIAFEAFDGDPHDLLLHKRRTRETFEAALAAYRDSDYERSRELFAKVADADPNDRAAAYLYDRSSALGSSLGVLDATDT